jgi:hypothetical protein
VYPFKALVNDCNFRPLLGPPEAVDAGDAGHSEGRGLQHAVDVITRLQPAKIAVEDEALVSSA